MKYFQVTITGMLAVPEHVQDPEYWAWSGQDIADRITPSIYDTDRSGEGKAINDFEVDTQRLTVNGFTQAELLEEVHANDWHKHEGGCACLE